MTLSMMTEDMDARVGFVYVVEGGNLENKAVLLAESIREFGGPLQQSPIWAVHPRNGPGISQRTLKAFAQLDVFYVFADLNRIWPDYPLANKPMAAAFIERLTTAQLDTLCFLDTDTLVVSPPLRLVLPEGKDVAVRPIHTQRNNSGIPAGEPLNDFWSLLFQICGAKPERRWSIETTVDCQSIWAYFNSGLIAVRPEQHIFHHWQQNLEQFKRHPQGMYFFKQHYWFVEQALLATTILADVPTERVSILERSYNYPINLHAEIPGEVRASRLEEIVHLHYHQAFYHLDWLKTIAMDERMKTWLLDRLPLVNRSTSWFRNVDTYRIKTIRLLHRTMRRMRDGDQ